MTDLEILQSLPSLYPLKDFEEEAVLNICKMFEDIKAEIRHFMFDVNPSSSESDYACNYILDIIDKHIRKDFEAKDIAIKALKQEPCDDAISRQAAIDKWENTTLRGRTEFDQIIMMMPPVAPRPKMGQWIRVDSKKVRCSECDVIHLIAQYPQSANINYCPNCGTKMEVEEC